MSITFSGTGSFRNITPLVTGGEPFITKVNFNKLLKLVVIIENA